MDNHNTLIQVRGLTRFYSQTCAVAGIDFDVRKGDVLGFLGPNGAGKSTTMQMITGNLAPTRGSISIHGIDLLTQPKRAKAEIGYLPEVPPLYRELTVDEYLTYCARLHHVPRAGVAKALAHAKDRCGLGENGKRLIGNLSKGYQQRVGIAQAIIHTPAVIILDEPTVGLDPIQIREIRTLIRELGRDHGVILSTHLLPEVQSVCSRVQILHRGRLVFSDTMDGLDDRLSEDALVVAFRKTPPPSELLGIAGVTGLENLPGNRLRISFAPQANPAEAIVARAVAHGWGLQELTPQRKSLEQIFVELTATQHPTEHAA